MVTAEPTVSCNCAATGETQQPNRSADADVFRCDARVVDPPLATGRKMFPRMAPPTNTAKCCQRRRIINRATAGEFITCLDPRGRLESRFQVLAKQSRDGDQQGHRQLAAFADCNLIQLTHERVGRHLALAIEVGFFGGFELAHYGVSVSATLYPGRTPKGCTDARFSSSTRDAKRAAPHTGRLNLRRRGGRGRSVCAGGRQNGQK